MKQRNENFTIWFKHILFVNTKGLGMAKLQRKPSPKLYSLVTKPQNLACSN